MRIKAGYTAIPVVLGLIVILAYLNNAAGILDLPNKLVLLLFFAIGPAAIFGILGLSRVLESHAAGPALTAGTVFLVIGFAIMNLMLVVQQTIFTMVPKYTTTAGDAVGAEAAALVSKSVNLVQIGMDISWDIFFCLGMILFASAVYRHPSFGKILGISGIIVASALLAVNMHTFPIPPAESGLIDLGPLSAVWWLVVIIVEFVRRRKSKRLMVAADN